MTREEKIVILKDIIDGEIIHPQVRKSVGEWVIKALEREPCEDCISRQAVQIELAKCDVVDIHDENDNLVGYYNADTVDSIVRNLSPVTSQPKIGHWVMPIQDDGMSDPIYYQVRCSKCGFDLDPQTWHIELHKYGADKYCPNCGTKMVEPQKSEDNK